ncbi:LOW QUALITY PROTEIN: hypothetical protein Cgig2_029073 [Carnegiea gigantea]|uniref:Uncharacterized protein n=1 Tax=Carnegiea gigantea TaxID=171969 RepID=A0A9Q1QEW1_9CARY|nr:LOW QUALITY PROTEIN: hypothetical protein Cgig2_029073 [Carnegiea gigantea]
MIFEGLSFSVAAGKTFAVVGPSGSGKSTVISLVQRFCDPSSCSILLDGHDLRDVQLKWLREKMGLVNQEPLLFATTVAENILYGKEGAGMKQVVEATKAANVHSVISPHQMVIIPRLVSSPDSSVDSISHNLVGEGGTQLSGGQKQRIAIARAVLRNPRIVLLDEATSALDAESESVVQKALNELMSERTTIIVAHRLSTIRDVDQIILLKKGVVESGTHVELMLKGGEYAKLLANIRKRKDQSMKGYKQTQEAGLSFTESSINVNSLKGLASTSSREQKPSNKNKDSPDQTPSFRELITMSKPEFPCAVLGSVGAALTGIQAPLFALGITYMLTAFYSHDDSRIKHDVRITALAFLGLAIVTIPICLMQHYFYTLMGERITARVRLSMFKAMLSNEAGWFDWEENGVGSLTLKLAADATLVRTSLVDRLSTIVQNTALIVAAFVMAFKLSWRIAAITVAMFPLLIGASIAEQFFLRGFGGDYTSAYSRATSLAREAIANIRTVAAFGAEERISQQFSFLLNQPRKQALLRGHISGVGYGISELFAFCLYALTLWYASVLLKQRDSNFGDIIKSFMVLILTAFGVAEALALTPEIVKGSEALGSSLAVVGQSGSGKSTLISLVMRFYDPTSGSVLIDGFDIRSLNLRSLRRRISLVQQEPALFSTTIYENIRYGKEVATEIEIMKAAKAANAHGFISRMPDGYDAKVGQKGSQLSGGQKQRVAIAQAILKDPSVPLLDEATSALDASLEKLVQEALENLMQQGQTTIIVAHRLSSISNADSIRVLQTREYICSTSELTTRKQRRSFLSLFWYKSNRSKFHKLFAC